MKSGSCCFCPITKQPSLHDPYYVRNATWNLVCSFPFLKLSICTAICFYTHFHPNMIINSPVSYPHEPPANASEINMFPNILPFCFNAILQPFCQMPSEHFPYSFLQLNLWCSTKQTFHAKPVSRAGSIQFFHYPRASPPCSSSDSCSLLSSNLQSPR